MGNNYKGFQKQAVDEDVLTLARRRTAEVFDRFDTVSVSFSGGKDSTICLELAVEEALVRRHPLHVHFCDEEMIPDENVEYVERTRLRLTDQLGDLLIWRTYCLPFRFHNVCSRRDPWWYTWDPAEREKWIRPRPEGEWVVTEHPLFDRDARDFSWGDFDAVSWDPGTHGTVGNILGITAYESLTRMHAVTQKMVDNWIIGARAYGFPNSPKVPGVMKCYPIYDWGVEDVWLAIHENQWDYSEAYDRLAAHGVPAERQRFAQPTAAESMIDLRLWKECFPAAWARACDRVPGLRTAGRYADTDVYAWGDVAGPGPGQSWQDRVEQELGRWGDELRESVRAQVRFYVNYHYRRTDDPIIEEAHPLTGISWPFVLKMAHRGDLKERGRPEIRTARAKAAKHPEKWEEAMRAWREDRNR
jgi:predicted phosphoadenosine phosphosulfate sulfurtransferase